MYNAVCTLRMEAEALEVLTQDHTLSRAPAVIIAPWHWQLSRGRSPMGRRPYRAHTRKAVLASQTPGRLFVKTGMSCGPEEHGKQLSGPKGEERCAGPGGMAATGCTAAARYVSCVCGSA